jgi:hypothetical protein
MHRQYCAELIQYDVSVYVYWECSVRYLVCLTLNRSTQVLHYLNINGVGWY